MDTNFYKGVIPALMTPCRADGTPNFHALVQKAESLMEAGMRSVVYCGSMGDWPLLTDAQRQEGCQYARRWRHSRGCWHWHANPKIAASHAAHAARVGAKD